MIVHPRDPNTVFVAALGHVYGANPDRGVFRSKDGGTTWEKVLFKGDGIGAIDLAFDPSNPQTVYAALWAVRRPPWFIYTPANGPGSGLFKSTDGGTTWTPLTSGLPSEGLGRMGIAISPANPKRIYVIADAKEGGLFRSDDAGATFAKVSGDTRIWQRGWYFEKVAADPKNADIVYVPNTGVYKSVDGGKTWGAPIKASPGGDDYHQIWISPGDSNRLIVGGDQGTIVSVDGAQTWSSWYNQPTAQLYHVAADFRFPYWLTAAQQDSGPSRAGTRRHVGHSMHHWLPLCAGGEGSTAPDPRIPRSSSAGRSKCNVETGRRRTSARVPREGSHTGTRGRSRSCSRRPIGARSITPTSSSQDDRRRRDLVEDQRRSDARGSRRPAEPRRGRGGRRRARHRQAPRRRLHACAVADPRAAGMGGHRRGTDPRDVG